MDFTPHIILTPHQTRIYRGARALLVVAIIAVGIALAWRIAFPPIWRTFDMTTPGALINTMAPPTITPTDVPHYDAVADGSMGRATIRVRLHEDAGAHTAIRIMVRRGYGAFVTAATTDLLAPTIATSGVFAHGTLVARDGGVWVVTDDAHMAPIADAATLLTKGWSFDAVSPSDGDAGPYERARMFVAKDLHPDGTVFYAIDTDAYYQIWDGILYSLNRSDPVITQRGRSIVKIAAASRDRIIECTAPTSSIPWRRGIYYHCTIDLTLLADLPGTSYVTTIDIPATDIRDIAIILRPDTTTTNLRATLGLIRQRFLAQYGL